ncbi:MAG TPA: sulfatase [Thermoanaerobaculia bacterium]|nr:sulfatase [Thermoanaerobaculia bacterium]
MVPCARRGLTLAVACLIAAACGDASETPARAASRGSQRPPNIVLVVVDTLRADHLTPYGSPRPTSPNVQSLLADRGVVVEEAYAPAPWTIPSMVSLLTSRWPGELVSTDPGAAALPAGVPNLAAVLRARGYETAAFIGNPTLDKSLGFANGFDTFVLPENLVASLEKDHADLLTAKALRWLRREPHRRPFFLYVHYLDPHDPYDNPSVVDGRSPFEAERTSTLNGRDVHGVFLGQVPLRNPAADVAHLTALYDAEISYCDRFLRWLLAALEDEEVGETLVVLTADHGEELHDHGGWKHGRTLYQEQLRVPMIWRWPGRLPAGARVAGPARLLDVAPTLVAAAGGEPPRSWQGRNLLPLLRGEQRGQRPLLFAQHLADGPPRASLIGRRWKLILFDRRRRFAPDSELSSILYRQELGRLARVELYNLQRDPGEQHDQAAQRPDLVAVLAPQLQARVAAQTPGLRVMLSGADVAAPVELELRLRSPEKGWDSWFLGDEDRVEMDGDRLRVRLAPEALPKGILLPAVGDLLAVDVLAPRGLAVRLAASGAAYTGGEVKIAGVTRAGWPEGGDGPTLWLWASPPRAPQGQRNPEAVERLKALGYAG